LTIAHADITYLLPYETPSGGGYSIHRGGAIHIEGAESPSITEVTVDSPGGNGLLLSNYVRGAVIANSEFKWVGDSAIVMLGSTMDTQPCNGTNGDQPRGTQIVGCFIHEVGVWGKQGAGIFQALTSDTNISHTVIFVSAVQYIHRLYLPTCRVLTYQALSVDSFIQFETGPDRRLMLAWLAIIVGCSLSEWAPRGRPVERWDGRRQQSGAQSSFQPRARDNRPRTVSSSARQAGNNGLRLSSPNYIVIQFSQRLTPQPVVACLQVQQLGPCAVRDRRSGQRQAGRRASAQHNHAEPHHRQLQDHVAD
jgi:hypothetical protein